MATDLTLTTADGPLRTAEALPPGEVRGAVVVVQEAFGLNDHIVGLCDRLARLACVGLLAVRGEEVVRLALARGKVHPLLLGPDGGELDNSHMNSIRHLCESSQ